MNRQGFAISAVVSALAVGIGTVSAFAAVPIPGADGKIRACVKYEDINKYEQMRWITTATCPKGEKLIAWNAKGIQGPKGATGAAGPPGTPGADGKDGDPGISEAHFDADTNTGHGLGTSTSTIFTLTVPAGTYAVTATTEIINYYDDTHGVACSLNKEVQTRRDVLVEPDDSEVLTVIGKITTDDGKINLTCNASVSPGAEADDPSILATRIG